MERLTVRTPATWTDCLDMGGSRARARKGFLWMKSIGDSLAIDAGGELVAIAFLQLDDLGRQEFALAIKPEARAHMLKLCRLAHLTLGAIAETGSVIICHVMAGNRSGERMARLVGFVPMDGTVWIFNGGGDDADVFGAIRRRQQGCGQGGKTEPAAAAGGERSPACQPAAG